MRKTLLARVGVTHVEADEEPQLGTALASVCDDLPDALGDPPRNGIGPCRTTVEAEGPQDLQFDYGEASNGEVIVGIGPFYLQVEPAGLRRLLMADIAIEEMGVKSGLDVRLNNRLGVAGRPASAGILPDR